MTERHYGTSHAEALKSSSIIGGSTAITILVRVIRTKFLAILLGPTGVGLEAIYDSIVNLTRTFIDLGVSSSGVRQIAASLSSGDQRQVATTVITLRRLCLILGVLGAIVLYCFRVPISELAFGNAEHARDVGMLSIILVFGAVAGGQGALLQGARRIGDLAKMKILGALAGAGVSITCVVLWGQGGIAPYMIAAAAVSGFVSWIYARRVRIERIAIRSREVFSETGKLLRLGIVFMATGLMSVGALLLVRALVTREEGLIGTGQFQAASALATIYVGFILQAMGTDFYPRLTAVADNNHRCNQLVNEQTEISILLALPGILATLAIAPWIVRFFYSNRFDQAVDILYWQMPGVFLQINSWPIGYILLAKGRGAAFFWTDFAAYGVYVTLAWLGLKWFGLPGTGMAFLALYLFHWIMLYAVAKKTSRFSLSADSIRLSVIGVASLGLTLWARLELPEPWSTVTGALLTLLVSLYCLNVLVRLIGMDKVEPYLRKAGMSFLLGKAPPVQA